MDGFAAAGLGLVVLAAVDVPVVLFWVEDAGFCVEVEVAVCAPAALCSNSKLRTTEGDPRTGSG